MTAPTVFIDCGGPMHRISVNGKILEFEMHPYCGPTMLSKKGDPLKNQPMEFLKASSLWAQQGKRISGDGLCVYHHEPEPILERIRGNNYRIVGYHDARRGV